MVCIQNIILCNKIFKQKVMAPISKLLRTEKKFYNDKLNCENRFIKL